MTLSLGPGPWPVAPAQSLLPFELSLIEKGRALLPGHSLFTHVPRLPERPTLYKSSHLATHAYCLSVSHPTQSSNIPLHSNQELCLLEVTPPSCNRPKISSGYVFVLRTSIVSSGPLLTRAFIGIEVPSRPAQCSRTE